MDENTANNQSTTTSTGGNWFSSLITAGSNAYSANQAAKAAKAANQPDLPNATPPNWTVIGAIAGGVVLLLVVVLAFKK